MKLFEKENADGTISALTKPDYIKDELKQYLQGLLWEKKENEMRKRPLPLNFSNRIYNKLEAVMLKCERPIPNAQAEEITAEQYYEWYNEYCELCCWIEEKVHITYPKNKPEFCNYCGITTEAFEDARINGDYHKQEALNDIDTRIANSIALSAESGERKAPATEFRLTAKSGIGHRIQTTTAKEAVIINPITANSFTPLDELEALPMLPKQLTRKTTKKKTKNS